MFSILKFSIIISLMGGLSSGIGGVISNVFKFNSKNKIAGMYQITAGIMTGIVCFDMLPECFKISKIYYSIVGILTGIFCIFIMDYINENKFSKKKNEENLNIVSLSMALHNGIEGLAIGTGFAYSYVLGISVLISMFLHDIPEGLVVGIVNKKSGKNSISNVVQTIIVGAFLGIGCFVGLIFGNISSNITSFLLSIASGAMLYIVSCELIPYSNEFSKKKIINLMYILGILIVAITQKI